ncbi:MAG: hypothetical protein JWM78_1284 [Verrucomicrobiaceae bacterium]|nr:hypothetical protein [Verrucomicrobiaceae bacterium]
MSFSAQVVRRILALAIIFLSGWIWTRHSDVIQLIVLQRPVLFGRYSQGHFGSLLIATPALWAIASALWTKRPLGPSLANSAIGITTTVLAILVITYLAHFFHRAPLYVETAMPTGKNYSMQLAGSVRRRPPNQTYELLFRDIPEQVRSYPDAPPGYNESTIRLTTDANGFRNPTVKKHYDIVAVGDSFVAGSNVSDDQTWTHLLGQAIDRDIYNLGVGGSGPPTYMSNYVYFGLNLTPRVALFMIYEGNDFKENVVLTDPLPPTVAERIDEHFENAMNSSPVRLGLQRLSHDLLEYLGATRPVPGYAEKLGFMPIKLVTAEHTMYYSFDPKRVIYLNYSAEAFAASPEWKATANILGQIIKISRDNNILPLFIYAPSAPHVVLPLVKDNIPAEQLRYFVSLKNKNIPAADVFKQQVFANLDSEQNVVLDFCRAQKIDCLALTDVLRAATVSGKQTYFSYDQHWTPDGNAVAAKAIEHFLREKNVLN